MGVLEKRLSRNDWLMAALNTLLTQGIQNVKILQLAKTLDASRGSFYWHFQDRKDLLRNMLEFWEQETTDSVLKRASENSGDGMKKLCKLMEHVLCEDMELYDQSIRAWAKFDPMAAEILKRVDNKRLKFLMGVIKECGARESELENRARILMSYLAGDASTMNREDVETRRKKIRAKAAIITGRD